MGDEIHDDREHGHGSTPDIERWLDDGLARYANAEPRAGLEGRVLARLAGAREESSRRLQWWAVLAFGTAALAIAPVWMGQTRRSAIPHTPVVRIETPRRPQPDTASRNQSQSASQPSALPPVASAKRAAHERGTARVLTSEMPKLDQFPSPQPLSEQEQILMSYVTRYPETAVLVAQARAEALERDREEEAANVAKSEME